MSLPRIDSPRAAARWVRLLGQALWAGLSWVAQPVPPRAPRPLARPADTVVLVTLDGVRPRDLLATGGADRTAMPFLMRELVPGGSFLGSDTDPPAFRTGSPIGISMSGYQSIFSGRMTLCFNNEDPPPKGSTVATRIQSAFADDPAPLAAFATWGAVCDSLKADSARAILVRGPEEARRYLAAREITLAADAPADEPAFRAALEQLRLAPPRFLYLALDESDNAGHSGRMDRYQDVLARYDRYLRTLADEIDSLRSRGHRVTLIVTTDHGRGLDEEWVEHRWNIDGTARAWVFAAGHGIAARGRIGSGPGRTHFDIRPTVEYLLGILPRRRWWRGAVMDELLDDRAAEGPETLADRPAKPAASGI